MYNPAAVLLFPFPDFFDKFFSAKFMSAQPMLFEFFFHNILRCDAGMVCARKPEGVKARHPLPSYDYVLKCYIKGVSYMERACNVWRWNNYAIRWFFTFCLSPKIVFPQPKVIPLLLYAFWIITLFNHGFIMNLPAACCGYFKILNYNTPVIPA